MIGVLGGGSFGHALALAAARCGHEVRLLSRKKRKLGEKNIVAARAHSELAECGLIFVAVPSVHVIGAVSELGEHLDGSHYMVHVSRGLIGEELKTITEAVREVTPVRRVGALAGPLVAEGLRDSAPAGAIVGTRFPEVAEAVREAIGSDTLRIYDTRDVVGVEIASASVGLLALVAGFTAELGFDPSTRAVLLTRGLAEAQRLADARGADPSTISGLAGYGDLLAAAFGDNRPEIRLGVALAKGMSLEKAGQHVGTHIEGVSIARRVADFGSRLGVETPIAEVIASVLDGRLTPGEAVSRLMSRKVAQE